MGKFALSFFGYAGRRGRAGASQGPGATAAPRLLVAIATAALALAAAPAHAAPKFGAIVLHADSGAVLYEKDADARLYPASLTKVMTLYLTFEALRDGTLAPGQRLVVSRRAAGQPPSKLGLKPGATIKVEEAILAVVTRSANDIATVLAESLGGTETRFADMMTAKARELGMTRTVFRNASGLPDKGQTTSPRDMAVLALAIQNDFPEYFPVFSTERFRFGSKVLKNHNHLLTSYRGVDGIKTGYTRASGYNLITSAERNGVRLIGVVFGGRTADARDREMVLLLDRSYAEINARPDALAQLSATKAVAASASSGRWVPKTLEESGGGIWAVQVGAFRSRDAALKRASAAADLLSAEGRRLVVDISLAPTEQPIYRAQLTGVSNEAEARQTCRRLRQHNIGCQPRAPGASAG